MYGREVFSMKILTTKEAAKILRISERIRVLIRKKQLKAYKEGRRGGYRIIESELKRYIEQRLY